MLKLKDPSLFKQQCYLNGEWVSGTDTTEVTNPATGEVIGHVPKLGQAEAAKAIADLLCKKAQKEPKQAKKESALSKPSLPSEVELALKELLGTEIKVQYKEGKGTLAVSFYSDEQLRAFANLLGNYNKETGK